MTDNITESFRADVSDDEYRAKRLEHMNALKESGRDPFGCAFERSGRIADVRAGFEDGLVVRVAGRMLSERNMGKTVFADLNDGSGKIQIFINRGILGDDSFNAFKFVDLGDHLGVEGELFTTRTGEISIRVKAWTFLSKAINQPPEKFHGLRDVEDRYRMRYIDLFSNPETRERFNKRSAIISCIRRFLESKGYQEVETPMMQPHAGGAAAAPFKTHYNALDREMYMRIAPELYLKRLLVGGFDRIFELNRNFRNEGLDRSHNPEFTSLEIYEAYGSRITMRNLVQDMIVHVCDTVLGARKVKYCGVELDFTPPYREASYKQLISAAMGDDWFTLDAESARKRAESAGVPCDPEWDHLLVTREVYDKLVEKELIQPTFVTRIPREFIPLAKTCADDPALADVFEFVVAGRELCPGYTEQNDPLEQRRAFELQAGNEIEKIDEDFITALEYGMPPAGGMGMGIDRLVMILTDSETIRNVILFPQLKEI